MTTFEKILKNQKVVNLFNLVFMKKLLQYFPHSSFLYLSDQTQKQQQSLKNSQFISFFR